MKLLLTAAAIATLAATSAFAADTYKIDPTHTSVLLKTNHIGFSNVYLRVQKVEGEFTFDQQQPEKSSVKVTMQAASIDGFDEPFNNHLRSADFFLTETYPVITFASTDVKVTGENTGTITGDLTIKGLTQPATLNVTFNKAGDNPISKDYRAGFSATGVIKRSEYGINYGIPAIGDEVGVIIEVEGVRTSE